MRRRLLYRSIAALVSFADIGALAAATLELGASVLIFPRVVANDQRDTVVQITNGSSLPVQAVCFYVSVAGDPNAPALADVESAIMLEPKQSTHWVASRGRPINPTDPVCFGDGNVILLSDCDGAGFDPGNVAPAPAAFDGNLVCIQTDASGAPASGNALHGVATLIDDVSGEAAKYQALGLRGGDSNDGNADLCVGSALQGACPLGAEYDGCPSRWSLTHPAEGEASDGSDNTTAITIASCGLDLQTQQPEELSLTLIVTNEFAERFSAGATVRGSATLMLSDLGLVFQRSLLGSDVVATEINTFPRRGFVAIAEVVRTNSTGNTTSAINLRGHPPWVYEAMIRLPQ